MNCRKLRKQFSYLLDTKQSHLLPSDMSEHLKSCPACTEHVQAMKKLDTALRNQPDVEAPEGLESKLQAIPLICEKEGLLHPGRDDFRRTAIYVVPAALMVILGLTLASDFQFVVQTAIAALAFIAIALQGMRRVSGKS